MPCEAGSGQRCTPSWTKTQRNDLLGICQPSCRAFRSRRGMGPHRLSCRRLSMTSLMASLRVFPPDNQQPQVGGDVELAGQGTWANTGSTRCSISTTSRGAQKPISGESRWAQKRKPMLLCVSATCGLPIDAQARAACPSSCCTGGRKHPGHGGGSCRFSIHRVTSSSRTCRVLDPGSARHTMSACPQLLLRSCLSAIHQTRPFRT